MTLNDALTFFSAGQGFLLTVLFFFQVKNRPVFIWLACFMFIFTWQFVPAFIQLLAPEINPIILPFSFIFYLMAGPTLYRYTSEISGIKMSTMNWHTIPSILVLLFFIYQLIANGGSNQAIFSQNQLQILYYLTTFQFLSYLVFCLRKINRSRKCIKDTYSDIEYATLKWLFSLCLGLIVLISLDLAFGLIAQYIPELLTFIKEGFRWGLIVFVFFISFNALNQPYLLFATILDQKDEKYKHSGLNTAEATKLSNELEELMRNDHLFLNPQLTLPMLANRLGITTHRLSETINGPLGMRFYDYINSQRIEYSKQLLCETNMPVFDIAFQSGFNNKVSFYNAFKKWTEVTPSQFRAKAS